VSDPSCDVCGYTNHYGGCAAVPSVPLTIGWCRVCLQMNAMPGVYWAAVKCDKRDPGVRPGHWFDHETDRYYRGADPVGIGPKDAPLWDTRAEVPDDAGI